IEIHANNGKIIPCLISASLMYIHSEQYILFMLRNIEDIKNVQYELILAKEKAQESDQLKSAFLANMSHEIRTPMNGIMGFCELMINTEQPKEKQDFFLHYIYENSKQLLTLINDIIDISRIEARQLSVHQTETNLNKTIHDLEIYFKNEKNRINKYDINITSNVNLPDDSALILTDKTRLKQILINLINNALKFTHKGYIKFGYDYNKNDQSLLFYVNDTGIGISPKDQQMIFERFKQADQSTKRRYGGTGLGLAISKELVELMGGTIWVRSEPGAGTTFYFSLPYTPVLPRKEQTNVPENKKHDWTTKKILIIEDHIAGYNYLRSALEITGARLSWSKNGEHALKLLKNSSGMDAILMDINLPDMKGSALLSKIKEYAPSLPVIAQTAFAMQGDKEKMLEQGFDDYISKPIERQILMDKLSQLWND
ncbi:MAG: ATP-binding protein, partial [bacterium]